MISFRIRVEQVEGAFGAWVEGSRDETYVERPTRGEAVVALGETLDDTEVPL